VSVRPRTIPPLATVGTEPLFPLTTLTIAWLSNVISLTFGPREFLYQLVISCVYGNPKIYSNFERVNQAKTKRELDLNYELTQTTAS
jgi:hypothetical protein